MFRNTEKAVKNHSLKFRLILLLLTGCPVFSFCQEKTATSKLVSAVDSFYTRVPVEKLFIQTDKSYYTNTDTIWLKAYVLDAALNYSQQSGMLYTELVNDTGKVILRQSMPLRVGISFGQVVLDSALIMQGNYTLRAYTNWMQNQPAESFFSKQVYIAQTYNEPWLVNAENKPAFKDGKYTVENTIQFTRINHFPVRLQDLNIRIMDGYKILNREKLQTDIDGKLNFSFPLPDKADTKKLNIIAEETRKGGITRRMAIPVSLNRPEFTDVQFMPEGGQMVAGLRSRIGFKAVSESGDGVMVKGNIVDSKNNVLASFESSQLGMGSFELTPVANEIYSARITFPNNVTKSYPLPAVNPNGIVLRVTAPAEGDSVSITIDASPDILQSQNHYSLIAQSGGKVCYGAGVTFKFGVVHGNISKNAFSSGITRFTLFDAEQHPIAERLFFIDHHDELKIKLNADKQVYQPKDSVALQLQVNDKDNKPVQGSFSLAITDNSQVKPDSTNIPDIRSYMLLTGDLKGNVEQPGYYFNAKDKERYHDLDNLLLTQGWVSYSWQNVFDPKFKPAFKAQPEFEITGQISRTGGKAIGGLPVMLLSTRKPVLMMDTVADAKGRFTFRHFPKIDTGSFMIQVKDKRGRMFEATVAIDEFTPPLPPKIYVASIKPWYVNTDSTLMNYADNSRAYSKTVDDIKYPPGSHHLREVKIKAIKTIKGSHNLNGPGKSDQVLDEKDMTKLGKTMLIDLLLAKIHGFRKWAIFDKGVRFVFDGLDMGFFYDKNIDPTMNGYYERVLGQFSAEDIKGIEVMYNDQFNGTYTTEYDPQIAAFSARWTWPAYIEITTWSGNGLFEKRKSSNYLYKPMPISWPMQFYKPKYPAKRDNTLADLRSTVYWEPNIITDTAGKATLWFYTKGKPGNYTGVIQGSNLSGNVGTGRLDITVK